MYRPTDVPAQDDKQSLAHLMWYGDELDIVAIIADGYHSGMLNPDLTYKANQAVEVVLGKYEEDYYNTNYRFQADGFPSPSHYRNNGEEGVCACVYIL